MDVLGALINTIVGIMKIPLPIWGFTLSFWDISLCLLVGGFIIWILGGFFFGGK